MKALYKLMEHSVNQNAAKITSGSMGSANVYKDFHLSHKKMDAIKK